MSGTVGSVNLEFDAEQQLLCDVQASGISTAFLRTWNASPAGAGVPTDTLLDGATPYTPTGTVGVCAGARDVEVVVLCDHDPATNLNARFLRHFVYNPDGTIDAAFNTDPDGAPYLPIGAEQIICDDVAISTHTQILCDVQADGTSVPFVQVYVVRTDNLPENIAEQQVETYEVTLTGEPYEPTGTVSSCQPGIVECGNAATDTVGGPLPGAGGTITDTSPTPYVGGQGVNPTIGAEPSAAATAPLWTGGSITFAADAGPGPGSAGSGQHFRMAAATIQATRPPCDDGTAHLELSVDVTLTGPTPGNQSTGGWYLMNTRTGQRLARMFTQGNDPVGLQQTLTVAADVSAEDLASGDLAVVLWLETFHGTGHGWTADNFTGSFAFGVEGCAEEVQAQVVTFCSPLELAHQLQRQVHGTRLCDDTTGDGTPDTEYVELWGVDPDNMEAPISLGTYLAGDLNRPYSPVNPVDCGTSEQCGLDPADPAIGSTFGAGGLGTVVDTLSTPYIGPGADGAALNGNIGMEQIAVAAAARQAFWDGGSVTIAADAGPGPNGAATNEHYRSLAAILTAARPACDDGTVRVTVTARMTNDGPNAATGMSGSLYLANTANRQRWNLAAFTANLAVGASSTVTVTAQVPAEDLAAGRVAVLVFGESFHNTPKSMTLDQFEASYTYDTDDCPPPGPFQRVELCGPLAVTVKNDREPMQLCDQRTDGTVVPFIRHYRYGLDNAVVDYDDTTLRGAPFAPLGTVGRCSDSPASATVTIGTGVRRLAATDPVLDVVAEAGGLLQSVTVTVLTGDVTVTTGDGSAPVPAGVSLSWSVSRDQDGILDVFTVNPAAPAPGGDVIVSWTYEQP